MVRVPDVETQSCLIRFLSKAEIARFYGGTQTSEDLAKARICVTALPTPTPINLETVRGKAFSQVVERFKKNENNSGILRLQIDTNLFPFGAELVTATARDTLQFFGKDFLPDARLIVGGKTQWLINVQCERREFPTPEARVACLKTSAETLGAGSGWPPPLDNTIQAWGAAFGPTMDLEFGKLGFSPAWVYLSGIEPSFFEPSFFSAGPHELTHVMQWNSLGKSGDSFARAAQFQEILDAGANSDLLLGPTLWVEGSANYFGGAIVNIRYPGQLDQTLYFKPPGVTGDSPILEDLIKNFAIPSCPCTDEVFNERQRNITLRYWGGALMTELLIAQFGLDKTISVMTLMGENLSDKSATWELVFKKAFGVDWDVWTEVGNKYLSDNWNKRVGKLSDYPIPQGVSKAPPKMPVIEKAIFEDGVLTVTARGFNLGANPVKTIFVTIEGGKKCELGSLFGKCSIVGLEDLKKVVVTATAISEAGTSKPTDQQEVIALPTIPKILKAEVKVDQTCRKFWFDFDYLDPFCLLVTYELSTKEIPKGHQFYIDLPTGSTYSLYTDRDSTQLQFYPFRYESLLKLGLRNEFTITSSIAGREAKTYKGTFNIPAYELPPLIEAPRANKSVDGGTTLTWKINPILIGTMYRLEVREYAETWKKVASDIPITATSITLPPSTNKSPRRYTLRIQAEGDVPLGISSFVSPPVEP